MVIPRVLAVVAFTATSNFTGSSTGEVGRLGAVEDFAHEFRSLPPHPLKTGPIRYQAAGLHVFLPLINCWKPGFG